MDRPSISSVIKACRIDPGERVDLGPIRAGDRSLFPDKDDARASCADDAVAINDRQDRLFAEGTRALLVVLQGIDTAGKSGTIRTVFNDTGPIGVRVSAFGKPTEHELARDYLWRVHQVVPPKGFIGVFDRSHYEDVLVVKVRELAPKKDVARRYAQINAFEKHLTENGVHIVKIMLHVSKDKQAERLRERLENPNKHWKFNPSDIEERGFWDDYMDAYQDTLAKCSTKHAPWHVVPADSTSRRNAIVARIVRGALDDLDPAYPKPGWRAEDYTID